LRDAIDSATLTFGYRRDARLWYNRAETILGIDCFGEGKVTELTVELSSDEYRRLREEAVRVGKSPQTVAAEWLVEKLRLPTSPTGDREMARQALRAAGLLAELGPHLRERADPTVCLEGVSEALGRAGGKPLSKVVLEQRGAKG
jgi:hypothetical protein